MSTLPDNPVPLDVEVQCVWKSVCGVDLTRPAHPLPDGRLARWNEVVGVTWRRPESLTAIQFAATFWGLEFVLVERDGLPAVLAMVSGS